MGIQRNNHQVSLKSEKGLFVLSNMNFKFYRPQLEYIDVLEPSLRNIGEYIIAPANYRMRQNINNDLQFGFIQVNLTNPNSYSGLPITP